VENYNYKSVIGNIAKYIGYIMGIIGFAAVIWTWAAKSTAKDYDVSALKNDMTELKTDAITKEDIKVLTDSLSFYNAVMEQKMNEVINAQNALRRSYIKYIKSAVPNRDKYLELMKGVE
jgi:hypothetical protein